MTTVIVLGGGMGGLSAAHELAERGIQVKIYEKRPVCGGKARSSTYPVTGTGGRPDLPAEHGFRFFPGFYRHLEDTMTRIPYNGGTVFDNLEEAPEIAIAQEGKPLFTFPSNFPTGLTELVLLLKAVYNHHTLGVPDSEAWFFIGKIICFLGSCTDRRVEVYENIHWWDFIDAASKSGQYQKICAKGLTLSLVAMRPTEGSTLTVGTILVQILWNLVNTKLQSDRVLNGPTSDVWITPWVDHLHNQHAVDFHNNATVLGFNDNGAAITGVRVEENGAETVVTGDHYVLALPVEVTRTLMTDPQMTAAGIIGIKQLDVEWMNGAMFYTNRDATIATGHVIYAGSPWAITSIEQQQFWGNFDLSQYGNGSVVDILSSIISEWDEAGNKVFLQEANQAPDADTVLDEMWAQIKAHRTLTGSGALADADLEDRLLDPAIQWQGGVIQNDEPLLVNTTGSLQHRPDAQTLFANLFLAADYVRTNTDLATMEAANEAGRRAANGVLDATASPAARAKVWKLHEPGFLAGFKDLDEFTYRLFGPASEPPICAMFNTIREIVDNLEALARERDEPSPLDELLRRMAERAKRSDADDEDAGYEEPVARPKSAS
jgi:uncharacterized protein with NAD-binding domain and iron-sulfur cluster